jgi:hypothetical protein
MVRYMMKPIVPMKEHLMASDWEGLVLLLFFKVEHGFIRMKMMQLRLSVDTMVNRSTMHIASAMETNVVYRWYVATV